MMMKLSTLLLVVLSVAHAATAQEVVQCAGADEGTCGNNENNACKATAGAPGEFKEGDMLKITYEIPAEFTNDDVCGANTSPALSCDVMTKDIFVEIINGTPTTTDVTIELTVGGASALCPYVCLDTAASDIFTGICQPGDGSGEDGCVKDGVAVDDLCTAALGSTTDAVVTVECISGPCAPTIPPTAEPTTPTAEPTTPATAEPTTPPTAEPTTPPSGEQTTPPTAEPTTPPSGEQTTPPPGGQTTPPPGEETTAEEESAVVRCEAETEITSCGGTVDDPCQAYASATARKYAMGDMLKITYDIPTAFVGDGATCNGALGNVDCDVYSKVVYVVIAEGKPTAEGVDVAISESAAHVLCPQNCLNTNSDVFAGICQLGESANDGCLYPDVADPEEGPRGFICSAALGSGADATVSVECVSGTCYVWEGSAIALRTGVAALFASLLAMAMQVV